MISYETFFYAKLKEAIVTKRSIFKCKSSCFVEVLLNLLFKHGYIKNFKKVENVNPLGSKKQKKRFCQNLVEVQLHTYGDACVSLQELVTFSTPGRSIFVSYKNIHKYSKIKSLLVVSTSQGLLTGQDAVKKKIGGKLLFRIT